MAPEAKSAERSSVPTDQPQEGTKLNPSPTSGLRERIEQALSHSTDATAQRRLTHALAAILSYEAQLANGEAPTFPAVLSEIEAMVQEATQSTSASPSELIFAECRRSAERVARALYEDKVLDPYLTFKSAEDEEEYRRRERENKARYEEAISKGTPHGDLEAQRILGAQLKDAGDHGAARSPEYAQMVAENKAAIAAEEQAFADTAPPVLTADKSTTEQRSNVVSHSPNIKNNADLQDVIAAFKAAGVVSDALPDHVTAPPASVTTRQIASSGRS